MHSKHCIFGEKKANKGFSGMMVKQTHAFAYNQQYFCMPKRLERMISFGAAIYFMIEAYFLFIFKYLTIFVVLFFNSLKFDCKYVDNSTIQHNANFLYKFQFLNFLSSCVRTPQRYALYICWDVHTIIKNYVWDYGSQTRFKSKKTVRSREVLKVFPKEEGVWCTKSKRAAGELNTARYGEFSEAHHYLLPVCC